MQVTLDQIYGKIKSESYVVLNDGRTTICQLTLQNGYTVNGMSACVDAKDFDRDIGRKYAFENAVQAIWPLEGYLLAEKMFQDSARPVATNPPKKVHWTQTAKGKVILANRKPRGKNK